MLFISLSPSSAITSLNATMDACNTNPFPLSTLMCAALVLGLIVCLDCKCFYHRNITVVEETTSVSGEDKVCDDDVLSTNSCNGETNEMSAIICPYMARSKILELWEKACDLYETQTNSFLRVTNLEETLTVLGAPVLGELVFCTRSLLPK